MSATGMPARSLSRGQRAFAEALSILYLAAVAAAAGYTGLATLLFPELGAMTHDILARPWGKWASQPLRLVVTPVLTGVIGTLATRHLPYHVLTILLVVIASLGVIRLLRSAIAPALSAGVLPLVLGVTTRLYPIGIAAGLVGLAAMCVLWQRYVGVPVPHAFALGPRRQPNPRVRDTGDRLRSGPEAASSLNTDVDDVLESAPRRGSAWLLLLLAFVAVTGLAAQLTGLRFILFPPLIVIAYEMFGHPETHPWSGRPLSLPLSCGLTALAGVALVKCLGPGPAAAALGTAAGVVVLRAFDVHMPPAIAVGLIPLVMSAPTWAYVGSVTIGTLTLTGASLVHRRVVRRPRRGTVQDEPGVAQQDRGGNAMQDLSKSSQQ